MHENHNAARCLASLCWAALAKHFTLGSTETADPNFLANNTKMLTEDDNLGIYDDLDDFQQAEDQVSATAGGAGTCSSLFSRNRRSCWHGKSSTATR